MAYTAKFKEEVVAYVVNVAEDEDLKTLEDAHEKFDVGITTIKKWVEASEQEVTDEVIVTDDPESIEDVADTEQLESETETKSEETPPDEDGGVQQRASQETETKNQEASTEAPEVVKDILEYNRLKYMGLI